MKPHSSESSRCKLRVHGLGAGVGVRGDVAVRVGRRTGGDARGVAAVNRRSRSGGSRGGT
jgi:hypothetical protein